MSEVRACGSCQACCNRLLVPELSKANGQNCLYQCSQGCAVYPQRPISCRDFQCLWLWNRGVLQDEERPDRLGVLVSMENDQTALLAWEVWPGAALRPRVQQLLGRLAAQSKITLISHD